MVNLTMNNVADIRTQSKHLLNYSAIKHFI